MNILNELVTNTANMLIIKVVIFILFQLLIMCFLAYKTFKCIENIDRILYSEVSITNSEVMDFQFFYEFEI